MHGARGYTVDQASPMAHRAESDFEANKTLAANSQWERQGFSDCV